jgi:thioredoxin family protein
MCSTLLLGCLSCGPPRPPIDISGSAEVLLSKALAEAKKSDKHVFLLFTSPTCEWCKRFDTYHSDPDVTSVLNKHFVLLNVDIEDTPGGVQMYGEHGGAGTVPSFSILDGKGMQLANSGDGDQNIGFPVGPQQVEIYFAALRTACPKLTDEEIDVLRAKLNELRPTEEPQAEITPEPSAAIRECRRSLRTASRFA